MLTKEDLLVDGAEFKVSKQTVGTTVSFEFKIKKLQDQLRVYGAKAGGVHKYLGVLQPHSGHLKRTHHTLVERHAKVTQVFLWLSSMLWWSDGRLPRGYKVAKI